VTRKMPVVALVLALIPVATAHAAGSKPAGPATREPLLAGTTILRGDHTAHLKVRLPRSATLRYDSPTFYSPAIAERGGGRFVGVMLTRLRVNGTGQWFAQVRVTGCGTKNCVPGSPGKPDPVDGQQIANAVGFPETNGVSEFHQLTFPAGEYDLTLVADSAPVTVTITLNGLRGTTTLHPQAAQWASTQSVNPTFLPTALAPTELSAGGHAYVPTSLGVVVFAISYRFTVMTSDQSNWCLYSGTQSPPNGEFFPGCPGAEDTVTPPAFIIIYPSVNTRTGGYGIAFVEGDQTWSQGTWSAGANLIQHSNPATFLWLSVNS